MMSNPIQSATNTFLFEVTGRDGDDRALFAQGLADAILRITRVLKSLGDVYTPDDENDLVVVSLEKSNPALVGIDVRGKANERSGAVLVAKAHETFTTMAAGQIPYGLDASALGAIVELVRPVGRTIGGLRWWADGIPVEIRQEFADLAKASLAVAEHEYGTVEGRLEHLNIHGRARVFRIYPLTGPKSVECTFRDELLDDAIAAMDRKVAVQGRLTYRAADVHPSSVLVDSIEVYPEIGNLPTFGDLLGICSGSLGTESSEDYIARMRDEWD